MSVIYNERVNCHAKAILKLYEETVEQSTESLLLRSDKSESYFDKERAVQYLRSRDAAGTLGETYGRTPTSSLGALSPSFSRLVIK